MNTIAGGGFRLWWRGCVLQALGVASGVAIFGFSWQPDTSTLTVLGSIPLLVLQPLVVGYSALTAFQALNAQRIELERHSQYDGLSGLFNRMHWEKQVRAEFARFGRRHEPVVLVLADLDNFKRVNDSFGHPVGDEAIRRFAAALKRVLRETDVLGRFGGEEFGILLPGTRAQAALETVERLRRDLHDCPLTDQMLVTASFGLVELNPGISSVEEWLRLVDQMLYQAKDQGRDQVAEMGELTPSDRIRLDA